VLPDSAPCHVQNARMSSPHASGGATSPRGGPRRAVLVVLLLSTVVLLLGGGAAVLALSGEQPDGSDGADGADGAQPGRAHRSAAGGVAVLTRLVRVAGALHPAAERRLVKEVRILVEEYVEDAYVGKGTTFPGFTDEARRLARRDADVTTGRGLGGREREIRLRSGWARVSVLSPRPREPVGATAAVRLVLAAEGSSTTRSTVTGQLMLTRSARGWRVFGYDLAVAGSRGRVDATTEDGGEER
jgi:hypothetical protein